MNIIEECFIELQRDGIHEKILQTTFSFGIFNKIIELYLLCPCFEA